ncbi:MAG: protein phosphatase 2C domain-containing protein [Actinomycetota bacterium]|nr:protein phosphatase 2C domain-containing protein [Actinomycetota bacterium]
MKKEIKCVWTVASECGPVREKNEDSIYPSVSGSTTETLYAAVCDGLGGYTGGNIASKLAIEKIQTNNPDLENVIINADKRILEYQISSPEHSNMGTTMTLISIENSGKLKLAHIGDTRCYILSNRSLHQISTDHVVSGFNNMLTQALGTGKKLEPEIVDFQLSVGDVVLLCSDGFYNEVSESYIKRKLSEGIIADALVKEVIANDPKDNVSVVIVNIVEQ